MKYQRTPVTKATLRKKSKVGGLPLPDFKTYLVQFSSVQLLSRVRLFVTIAAAAAAKSLQSGLTL